MHFSVELSAEKFIDHSILDRMNKLNFVSLTWHIPANRPSHFTNELNVKVLNLAEYLLSVKKRRVLIHVPCQNITKYEALAILDRVKKIGVKHILAVRGDLRHAPEKPVFFQNTIDFIGFIRRHYNSYFKIGVAGYPNGHPLSKNIEDDLEFLKLKVDSGADFILTQFEFDPEKIHQFLHRSRNVYQIKVPIFIGIYLLNNIKNCVIAEKCGVTVPEALKKQFDRIKHDQVTSDEYSVFVALQLIRQLFFVNRTLGVDGVHIYSMNKLMKAWRLYQYCNYMLSLD